MDKGFDKDVNGMRISAHVLEAVCKRMIEVILFCLPDTFRGTIYSVGPIPDLRVVRIASGRRNGQKDEIIWGVANPSDSIFNRIWREVCHMARGRPNSRKYFRVNFSLAVSLHKAGIPISFRGLTKNFSPGGAFITTRDWPAFRESEQVLLTFYLPPGFAEHNTAIRLLGTGKIIRIDRDSKGLGVQFNRSVKYFEKINHVVVKR